MRRLWASIEDLLARFGEWILGKLGWQVKGVEHHECDCMIIHMEDDPVPKPGDTFLLVPLRRDR